MLLVMYAEGTNAQAGPQLFRLLQVTASSMRFELVHGGAWLASPTCFCCMVGILCGPEYLLDLHYLSDSLQCKVEQSIMRSTCALLLWGGALRGVVQAFPQVGHHLLEDIGLLVCQAGSCRGFECRLRWLPCLGACTRLLRIVSLQNKDPFKSACPRGRWPP